MIKSLKYKFHVWCADNFDWIQYPNVMPLTENARLTRPKPEKPKMSLLVQFCVLISSIFGIVVSSGLLIILLFLFYILITVATSTG
ncbi:MAG: hypothetical protein ACXWAT_00915 [Methylobacter sp.]